jgi:hypothetical protein
VVVEERNPAGHERDVEFCDPVLWERASTLHHDVDHPQVDVVRVPGVAGHGPQITTCYAL